MRENLKIRLRKRGEKCVVVYFDEGIYGGYHGCQVMPGFKRHRLTLELPTKERRDEVCKMIRHYTKLWWYASVLGDFQKVYPNLSIMWGKNIEYDIRDAMTICDEVWTFDGEDDATTEKDVPHKIYLKDDLWTRPGGFYADGSDCIVFEYYATKKDNVECHTLIVECESKRRRDDVLESLGKFYSELYFVVEDSKEAFFCNGEKYRMDREDVIFHDVKIVEP